MTQTLDLGDGHTFQWASWTPDRRLNPDLADVADIDPCGGIVVHVAPDGSECRGFVHFDVPGIELLAQGRPVWQVESLDPLTISPSVLCGACGDHGFIRSGRWQRA